MQHICSYSQKGLTINSDVIRIVAVTQRVDKVNDRDEIREGLDQRLVQWLVESGFLPVAVPNGLLAEDKSSEIKLENWMCAVNPAALVLSGGNDIGESLARDATERYLLSWAEKKQMPVLGICRGLQMMAVWGGSHLVRKSGHVGHTHKLLTDGNHGVWPEMVNSYHNWGLITCPDGFQVAGRAEDGSIEAIAHKIMPWEGWMWHPERDSPFCSTATQRLQSLFNE